MAYWNISSACAGGGAVPLDEPPHSRRTNPTTSEAMAVGANGRFEKLRHDEKTISKIHFYEFLYKKVSDFLCERSPKLSLDLLVSATGPRPVLCLRDTLRASTRSSSKFSTAVSR
jgi:hypothetical protein